MAQAESRLTDLWLVVNIKIKNNALKHLFKALL